MQTPTTQQKPWYHVRMVWLILAFPVVSVCMGMTILYFAITTYDGLVVDDYYKQGKNINLTLHRDKAALAHGLESTLDIDYPQRLLKIRLKAAHLAELPARIQVSFLHTTRAGHDRVVVLEQLRPGEYQTLLPDLVQGHWSLQIEAGDWRLVGLLVTPADTQLRIVPAPVS
jgi:hypothetical protein